MVSLASIMKSTGQDNEFILEAGMNESSSTQKLCLENIVKLYLRVRLFICARDYITSNHKIRKKQTKSKSLRKNLKGSKDIQGSNIFSYIKLYYLLYSASLLQIMKSKMLYIPFRS